MQQDKVAAKLAFVQRLANIAIMGTMFSSPLLELGFGLFKQKVMKMQRESVDASKYLLVYEPRKPVRRHYSHLPG